MPTNHSSVKFFSFVCLLSLSRSLLVADLPAESQSRLEQLYTAQIPKRETGVTQFLEKYPDYDGRGVVIAVFDTGVDPEAPGMQITSTGERKLVDIYDASGAGDVDTTTVAKPAEDGTITALTGRILKLPSGINNPTGEFHLGIKAGKELFHKDVWDRVMSYRNAQTQNLATLENAAFLKNQSQSEKHQDGTWAQQESDARAKEFETYLTVLKKLDRGPFYDCLLWQSTTGWCVIIDTDEDGDLTDEKILQPFGIKGDWATFPDYVSMNFAVQVYDEGNKLSIVTNSGSHGTHVASIAAAHFPDNPALDGIAPGARILSIRIGDVRSGGSSTYFGESLATAIAAQHQVDIMNASWGGQSLYQDASSWGVKLYEMLVQKYGVTAFVSTGNDGPALSTMGAPGGESHSVIGVGAYVSPEMGKLLYSVVGDTPETTFMFSARGPARNGDLGTDIIAPGAAITSLAKDSLDGTDLYNGTSMASPSAAGVGALLISAAKQTGLHYSPARIRYALMNTAKYLESEDPFSQGSGLIQTEAAWDHLKKFQTIGALDLFYKVDVDGNSYTNGPGYYLRTSASKLDGIQNPRILIEPEFPDAFSNRDEYDVTLYFSCESSAEWIHAPEFMHLSNAGKTIRPELDLSAVGNDSLEHPVHFAELKLTLVDHPEAGPLIQIPFTIIGAEEIKAQREFADREIDLSASQSAKFFVDPADGLSRLTLDIKRYDDEASEKLYVFHALTLVSYDEIEAYETRQYFRLKSGESTSYEVPTIPGKPLEINVHQVWSGETPTHLTVSGTWHSLSASTDSVFLQMQGFPGSLEVKSVFESKIQTSASIDAALIRLEPGETSVRPYDSRGSFPRGKRDAAEQPSFVLHQEFSTKPEESIKVCFVRNEYSTDFNTGGGLIEVYDSKGFLVQTALPPMESQDAIELPAEKLTLVREFISQDLETLNRLKTLPLLMRVAISEQPVSVFEGWKNYAEAKSDDSTSLSPNRTETLVVSGQKDLELPKLPNSPVYLEGKLSFEEDNVELNSVILTVIPNPTTTSEVKKTDEDTSTSGHSLKETIYNDQLTFLKESRWTSSGSKRKERSQLIKDLSKDSTDPKLWLEGIYDRAINENLLHAWLWNDATTDTPTTPGSDGKSLDREVTRMIQNCHPEKVAEYLGAQPVIDLPDSPEGKSEKLRQKNFKELAGYLAEVNLIAADSKLSLGDLPTARSFLNESKRWKPGDALSDKINLIEARLHYAEGHPGLSLEPLRNVLEKQPQNELIRKWIDESYRELGWSLQTDLNKLYRTISSHADKLR